VADYILVGNQAVRKALAQEGVSLDRLICVPYGADHKLFKPASVINARPFRVLCLGLITWRKGIHYLLEAWRQLRLREAELLVVGNADHWGASLLRQHEGEFRHLSGIPHGEVPALMAAVDIVVCPSLWETGPMVVFEAMASGLPVIATPNSAGPVRHGVEGLIVPARDAPALAAAIDKLYVDAPLRREIGANARMRVLQGYTWEHYRKRIAAVYEAIAKGTHPNRQLVDRGLMIEDPVDHRS
jgi:glycosyltransferase involved in cell wall biosynthesis